MSLNIWGEREGGRGVIVAQETVCVRWHGDHEKQAHFGRELIETVGFVLCLRDMYL